jgi:hypothetical protein
MWLLEPGKNEGRQAYAAFFAVMPKVFRAEVARAVAVMWPRVATSSWMVCASASNLRRNDVAPATLLNVAANANIDLLGSFAEQREWTLRETKNLEFPEEFEKCEAALRAAARRQVADN